MATPVTSYITVVLLSQLAADPRFFCYRLTSNLGSFSQGFNDHFFPNTPVFIPVSATPVDAITPLIIEVTISSIKSGCTCLPGPSKCVPTTCVEIPVIQGQATWLPNSSLSGWATQTPFSLTFADPLGEITISPVSTLNSGLNLTFDLISANVICGLTQPGANL